VIRWLAGSTSAAGVLNQCNNRWRTTAIAVARRAAPGAVCPCRRREPAKPAASRSAAPGDRATLVQDAAEADVDRRPHLGSGLTPRWGRAAAISPGPRVPGRVCGRAAAAAAAKRRAAFPTGTKGPARRTTTWNALTDAVRPSRRSPSPPPAGLCVSSATATATLTVVASPTPFWTGSAAALTRCCRRHGAGRQHRCRRLRCIRRANIGIAVAPDETAHGSWSIRSTADNGRRSPRRRGGRRCCCRQAADSLVPAAGFLGIATLTAYAWDGSGGSAGDTARVGGQRV